MKIEAVPLPYDKDALEPYLSEKTLSFHYDKHHLGYVSKLNDMIRGTAYESLPLEEIISRARANGESSLFNNAAQAWNHDFFWKSMSPNGGKPDGRIKDVIEAGFGSINDFKERFRKAATGRFGSGWVWLVVDHNEIRIISTGNAETPVGTALKPLLVLDVWEHAYYLDYQNDRKRFVDAYLDNLINWNYAEANLDESETRKVA
jgi:Fe-Mn family superoxide dismutase